MKTNLKKRINGFKSEFSSYIGNIKQLAQDLGIETFSTDYDVQNSINERIDKIIKLLEQVEKSDLDKYKNGELKGIKEKYNNAKYEFYQLPFCFERYREQSFSEIKAKLNLKVKSIIDSSIRKKLNEMGDEINSEKDSLIHRIIGRNRLKEARLKNLYCRLNLALAQNQESNPRNSVREMVLEMYKCAIIYYGGILPPEMKSIVNAIRANFKFRDRALSSEEELLNKAQEAIYQTSYYGYNSFPTVFRSKTKFFRLYHERKEAEELDLETNRLMDTLRKIGQESNTQNLNKRQVANQGYNDIMSCLNQILENVVISNGEENSNEFRPAILPR